LPSAVWDRLVDQDRDFLRWQLATSNVRVVLLNGASVVRWVQQAGLVGGFSDEDLGYKTRNGHGGIRVSRARAGGVLFLGWNRPVAGALAAAGRQRLIAWVGQELRRDVPEHDSAGVSSRGKEGIVSTAIDLVDGFVPDGAVVHGVLELTRVLEHWVQASNQPTVGEVGVFGGSAVLTVKLGADEFVLNRDTKRAAVHTFLAAAAQARGADNLPWHITANRNGTINRVSYRPDHAGIPGWYAYVRQASPEPRELR
jgi:hypothetical protein